MATYEHYCGLLPELVFQVLHVSQHMQTIDATVSPKVNQHNLPFKIFVQRNRLAIEPVMVLRELSNFQ